MASVRKHGDKRQARIQRQGQPSLPKSFNNKADAAKWARNTESQIDLGTLMNLLKISGALQVKASELLGSAEL